MLSARFLSAGAWALRSKEECSSLLFTLSVRSHRAGPEPQGSASGEESQCLLAVSPGEGVVSLP